MAFFCRDWKSTLRRASFRGVPFFVESEDQEGARALIVHEFPNSDTPFIEDQGKVARPIQVNAYVTGDDIEAQIAALVAACEQRGPAVLNLPIARFSAHCQGWKRSYKRDSQGFVSFALTFWREGAGPGVLPLLGLARAIEFAVGNFAGSLTTAFAGFYSTIGAPAYVSSAAGDYLRSFIGSFDAAVRLTAIEPVAKARVLRSLGDGLGTVAELVRVGSRGDSYSTTGYAATSDANREPDLVGLVDGVIAASAAGLDGVAATEFLAQWIDYGDEPAAATVPATRLIAANQVAFNNLVRASALAHYAAAATQRVYRDVREARQARADAAEYFDGALYSLAGWESYDAWRELATLRGQVVDHLHRLITDMAPIVQIRAQARMPAVWWANRLYGDAGRAAELVERNGVKHPGFMPLEFEALAR